MRAWERIRLSKYCSCKTHSWLWFLTSSTFFPVRSMANTWLKKKLRSPLGTISNGLLPPNTRLCSSCWLYSGQHSKLGSWLDAVHLPVWGGHHRVKKLRLWVGQSWLTSRHDSTPLGWLDSWLRKAGNDKLFSVLLFFQKLLVLDEEWRTRFLLNKNRVCRVPPWLSLVRAFDYQL